METRILARHHTLISIIGFLLIVATTSIGCKIFSNVNRVIEPDPVLLTRDDLHRMGLMESDRIGMGLTQGASIDGPIKESSFIVAFEQRRYQRNVQYWLFASSSAAKKAAAGMWIWFFAAVPNFHPEFNPEDVIGDATWRRIHRNRKEWENGPTDIWFVKYNLLVSVRTKGHPSNRLQFARDTARNIEAKINAVVEKNENTDSL